MRIIDWSSDVCSSDLERPRTCVSGLVASRLALRQAAIEVSLSFAPGRSCVGAAAPFAALRCKATVEAEPSAFRRRLGVYRWTRWFSSPRVPFGRALRDQADRAISKDQLHALLRFHLPPIDVVVYPGSDRKTVGLGKS